MILHHDLTERGYDIIYECHDMPIPKAFSIPLVNGRKRIRYYDLVCAFDIETTTVDCGGEACSFMYLWQFCMEDTVCMGRTWEEFIILLERIHKELDIGAFTKLVIYSHNLGYEMHFLSGYLNITESFAVDKHKPLYFRYGGIEFRCSWKLTNMALGKFLSKTKGVVYKKQSGKDYNYLKLRTPTTPLENNELLYAYCDVRGLCQGIRIMLKDEGRTLGDIPLTSTGFVRERARAVYQSNTVNRDDFIRNALSPQLYGLCRDARRGGNTHANHRITGETILVCSYDKKSSYPWVMVTQYFPVTPFAQMSLDAIKSDKYCLLIDVTFRTIIARKNNVMPYISISKCLGHPKIDSADNGRLFNGRDIRMVLTEIDYHIIQQTYLIAGETINSVYGSRKGKLPKEFRELIMEDFKIKCQLEDGDPYLYSKFKNKINAYFGMMLTDILHESYQFDGKEWLDPVARDPYKGLEKYYKGHNNFLSYQQGLWVTAHARLDLQRSIDIVGDDTCYVDTDSNKHIGNHDKDFELLNESIIKCDEENDVPAYVDYNGKRTYLGKWEYEGEFEFCTWGAKKYATRDSDGNFAITVAGLNKELGSSYISDFAHFKPATKIPYEYSGRLTMQYVTTEPYHIKIGDEIIEIRNYIAAVPASYTLSISADYADVIEYDEDIYLDTGHLDIDLTMLPKAVIIDM